MSRGWPLLLAALVVLCATDVDAQDGACCMSCALAPGGFGTPLCFNASEADLCQAGGTSYDNFAASCTGINGTVSSYLGMGEQCDNDNTTCTACCLEAYGQPGSMPWHNINYTDCASGLATKSVYDTSFGEKVGVNLTSGTCATVFPNVQKCCGSCVVDGLTTIEPFCFDGSTTPAYATAGATEQCTNISNIGTSGFDALAYCQSINANYTAEIELTLGVACYNATCNNITGGVVSLACDSTTCPVSTTTAATTAAASTAAASTGTIVPPDGVTAQPASLGVALSAFAVVIAFVIIVSLVSIFASG